MTVPLCESCARLTVLEARIQLVEALHAPMSIDDQNPECLNLCGPWPCATLQVLNGDHDERSS
jgi:hypothetical protein